MKTNSTSQPDDSLSRKDLMKRDRQTKSVTLSTSRWLAYATAGMASNFGMASGAEGEIHYSGIVNVTMGDIKVSTLPLTGGASLQFFIYDFGSGSGYAPATFQITGAGSASARESFFQVADIRRGSPVSLGPFTSVGNQHRSNLRGLYGGSNFGRRGGGFIGFKFNIGNGIQYGWARLQVTEDVPPPFSFRYIVKDYAWGDPGDPVAAGQRTSFDEQVGVIRQAGSLGLLAIGAAGLEAWRNACGQAPTGH